MSETRELIPTTVPRSEIVAYLLDILQSAKLILEFVDRIDQERPPAASSLRGVCVRGRLSIGLTICLAVAIGLPTVTLLAACGPAS